MSNAATNGHAAREKLALEVQAEALRPTPPINVAERTARERLEDAWQRIRHLESTVARLRFLLRSNADEYQKEKARQRRELGIKDEISEKAAQRLSAGGAPARASVHSNL